MKKFLIFYSIFGILILLVTSVLLVGILSKNKNNKDVNYLELTDNSILKLKHEQSDETLTLEVAKSDQKRTDGLMFRTQLEEDTGMIFVSNQQSEMAFWMKNTLISLDMIFLDKDLKVISFYKSTKPNQIVEIYESKGDVLYGVETKSGWSEKANLKVGDSFTVIEINN